MTAKTSGYVLSPRMQSITRVCGISICVVAVGAMAGLFQGEPSRRLWGSSYLAWAARMLFGLILLSLAASQTNRWRTSRISASLVIFIFSIFATFFPQGPESGFYIPELTAITLICFSLGAVYLETPVKTARVLVPWLALCGLGLNTITLIGYLYGALPLYGNERGSVGILSAATSLLIGVGLLAASDPKSFPLRLLAGNSVTAQLLRAILPATFGAMLLGEVIADVVRQYGWGARAVQDALQTFFATVFISGVVFFLARRVGQRLDRTERQRDEARQALSTLNASLSEMVVERTSQLECANRELKALLSALPDWIIRLRRDGTILHVHAPMQSDHREEISRELLGKLADWVRANDEIQDRETVHFRLSAEALTFEARFVPSGGACEFLAVVRDMSELARLESDVLEASVKEQCRIGEELHDGLGQQLTALAFMSKLLEIDLANRDLSEARQAAHIGEQISACVGTIRSLARGLLRYELGSDSLVEALQELAATTDKSLRIHCTFEGDPDILLTDRAANLHLYRISQEAINNAIAHGKAQRIHMELKCEGAGVIFRIRDDGGGANLPALSSSGIGLRTMEFRTRRLGGRLGVESHPGRGTLITCTLPDRSFRNEIECGLIKQLLLFP